MVDNMNQYDFAGRVAVVTGGARGLGYSIAERILLSGASVSLWDVDAAKLADAAKQLASRGAVDTAALDLTESASVQAATEATVARFGKIDILINNAGITGGNAATWEVDPATWRRVIDVNLVGPFLTSRSVVPVMLRQGYGRIVNIASVAGKEGNPNASHYSASKAGLIGLTKSLGKELATRGILVNCVTPAAANTDLFAQMTPQHIEYMRSKIPMNRFVEPKEVAALVCWLASEECSFSTGAMFDISGGRATY
jgi:NAD(P)-dependent dehydrogenase (short-subunit alcohol dehydrogenase family)